VSHRCDARLAQRLRPATCLWLAVAALIGLYLVASAFSVVIRLTQPTEFVYGEAVVLAQVRRFDLGQPLYPPTTTIPLSVTAYTPIYYVLVGAIQQMTHDDTYLTGRLVSVTAMLLSAGFLVTSVRAVAGRWWGGLLAAGLFLTQNLTVLLWAGVHRVDALALCFTLAGLMLNSTGRPAIASAPLALALLTKQTYVVAIPSVCLELWPGRRALLAFLGPLVFFTIVVLTIGQVVSGGWLIWHTLLANANPLDFDYFSAMFDSFIQLNAVPVILAASFFALPALPRERQWRAYFLLAGLETLATMGKLGASSNYWLELTVATSALIGIQAVRVASAAQFRSGLSSGSLAALVFSALLIAVPGYAATVTQSWQMHVADPSPQLDLASQLATHPGEVLTDDPGLVVLSGKPVEFEFIIFTILAAQRIWDEQPILQAIASHRFDLVVLSQPLDAPEPPLIAARWSPSVRDALLANYVPAGQDDGYWMYRPAS
jgi:hypothetical protein